MICVYDPEQPEWGVSLFLDGEDDATEMSKMYPNLIYFFADLTTENY